MGKDRLPGNTKVRELIEKQGNVEPFCLAPDTSAFQQQGGGDQRQDPSMTAEPAPQGQDRMPQPDAQLLVEKTANLDDGVDALND